MGGIFRARAGALDSEYGETAKKMREPASSEYGLFEFAAISEGDQEIAIYYWQKTVALQFSGAHASS